MEIRGPNNSALWISLQQFPFKKEFGQQYYPIHPVCGTQVYFLQWKYLKVAICLHNRQEEKKKKLMAESSYLFALPLVEFF